jgi:hypothetical protein
MRSFIAPRQAVLGQIFPSATVPGKPSTTGSTSGHIGELGQCCSRRCNWKSTKTAGLSTPPSFERTSTLRGEKGDRNQRAGALSTWLLHDVPRTRRHQRSSAPPRTHAGSAARIHGSRKIHSGARNGKVVHCRHWLRLKRNHHPGVKAEDAANHMPSSQSQEEAATGSQDVQKALPCRGLFPTTSSDSGQSLTDSRRKHVTIRLCPNCLVVALGSRSGCAGVMRNPGRPEPPQVLVFWSTSRAQQVTECRARDST